MLNKKTIKKKISKLVRDDYTLGGDFGSEYSGDSGLCFTYDQLAIKEKEIKQFISQVLDDVAGEEIEGKKLTSEEKLLMAVYGQKKISIDKACGYNQKRNEILDYKEKFTN